MICRVA